jgi:hypothetical protein
MKRQPEIVGRRGEHFLIRIPAGAWDLIEAVRKLPGRSWDHDEKVWRAPDSRALRSFLLEHGQLPSQETSHFSHSKSIYQPYAHSVSVSVESPTGLLADRITLSLHPQDPGKVRMHVPVPLLPAYLPIVKNMHGRRWAPEHKVWVVPLTKVTVRFVEKYLPDVAHWTFQPGEDIPERVEVRRPARENNRKTFTPARYEAEVTKLEQTLLLKRYSWRTVKSYKSCFRKFVLHYDDIEPQRISRAQIDDYITHLIKTRHITESHQNQILSAVKMYYSVTIDQEAKVRNLIRPKKSQKLPHVLTEEEIGRLLQATA